MGERKNGGVLGEMVGDVRDALISEGWFGRRQPEGGADPLARWGAGMDPEPPHPRSESELRAHLSFEEAWATREPADGQPARDRDVGLER
jgi:hypothetical protein